jgi:thiol:disulfide interchange protein DsbD
MPDAGWHTYWQNPGDSGMATSVQWTLPKGWKAGPIEWPVPEVLTGPSGTNYCYPKEVLLPELVTPPADASLGQQITLKAKVGWLVCNEVCVAGNADLTLDLTIGVNNVANHDSAPRLRAVVAALPKPPKTPLRAWRKASSVILDLGSNAPSSGTAFFSSDAAIDPVQPVIVASKGGDHELRLKISPYAPPRLNRLRGILVAPRGRTLSNGSRAILVDIPINSGGSR